MPAPSLHYYWRAVRCGYPAKSGWTATRTKYSLWRKTKMTYGATTVQNTPVRYARAN